MDLEVERRLAGAQALNQVYLDTARLLIQAAPLVFADGIFALKGGTAINLFVRDMPRLSIDLDLVFVDHSVERSEALTTINQAIRNSSNASRPADCGLIQEWWPRRAKQSSLSAAADLK